MKSLSRTRTPWMVQCIMAAALVGLAGGISTNVFANASQTPEFATVHFNGQFLDVEMHDGTGHVAIQIAGPNGYALTRDQVTSEQFISADLVADADLPSTGNAQIASGEMALKSSDRMVDSILPDGQYFYEITQTTDDGKRSSLSGTFFVVGGIAQKAAPEAAIDDPKGGDGMSLSGSSVQPKSLQENDFIQINDLQGDGFTSLILDEDDPDQGNPGFWAVVNDSTVFKIWEGFPQADGTEGTPRLSILQGGNVGIGTVAPQLPFHVLGFGAQARIASPPLFFPVFVPGAKTDLFVGGTGLWFVDNNGDNIVKFNHSAPENALALTSVGTGMGTALPAAPLHVQRSNGTAQMLVEDTGGVDGQTMFSLLNGGGHPKFRLQDAAQSDVRWEFRTAGTQGASERFQINKIGSGAINAEFQANGDLTIAGSLSQGSSRSIKDNITPVDDSTLLAKLESLTLSEWSYASDLNERHVGPMAEDFHATFGLGPDNKHISPTDLAGVALAAAKALKADNDAKDQRIAELEARMARLEAMLD